MRWFWKLHRDWKHRAEKAGEEVEKSRRNLDETRNKTAVLQRWQDQNHFATLIKESLQLKNGHHSP